jgi:hypothetical protein
MVAIDIEGGSTFEQLIRNPNARMGVAIFDPARGSRAGASRLKTYQFISGDDEFLRTATDKFLFGKTTHCKTRDFPTHILSLLPPSRPIVLIAHSMNSDLATLKLMGFDARQDPRMYLVDTYPMSGDVLRTHRGFGSLSRVMSELRLEFEPGDLHYAGNDAHFTLRVALSLARRGYLQQCPNPGAKDMAILRALDKETMAPIVRRPRIIIVRKISQQGRGEVSRARALLREETEMLREVDNSDFTVEGLCWLFV